MSVSANWDFTALVRALTKDKPAAAKKASQRGTLRVAMRMRDMTENYAPVLTGELAASFRVEEITRRNLTTRGFRVFSDLEQAPSVEFGHQAFDGTFVEPVPFMRPARINVIPPGRAIMIEEYTRAINRG